MPEPTVCAILLTADRPDYARRAVEAFRAQTYPAKRLLIWDSGPCDPLAEEDDEEVAWVPMMSQPDVTIGELRNDAASFWTESDIICHWDDDDYSHPNRIAEQVALLQSSGAEAVGYREMLFWRDGLSFEARKVTPAPIRKQDGTFDPSAYGGEAWLYTNGLNSYCLGTSLCYWRKTWERRPFEARPTKDEPWTSEDAVWLQGVRSVGVSTLEMANPWAKVICPCGNRYPRSASPCSQCGVYADSNPRMVARIHHGNTSQAYNPALMRASDMQGGEWKRVPAWDDYCARLMK